MLESDFILLKSSLASLLLLFMNAGRRQEILESEKKNFITHSPTYSMNFILYQFLMLYKSIEWCGRLPMWIPTQCHIVLQEMNTDLEDSPLWWQAAISLIFVQQQMIPQSSRLLIENTTLETVTKYCQALVFLGQEQAGLLRAHGGNVEMQKRMKHQQG